jgi:hypothetical protein
MRIVQIIHDEKERVALVETSSCLRLVNFNGGTYALANLAIEKGVSLIQLINQLLSDVSLDYQKVIDNGDLLTPITHPDPAHCLISGTGLTHLGSASTRSEMHTKLSSNDSEMTDSMKMFKLGFDGGKPEIDVVGAQPEWFYKGDGGIVCAPETDLPVPCFAEDAGEEPELVGLYIIGPNSEPWRVGFAIGNEFSDHVTEQSNYLWLAHSKLRSCSFGPEIILGDIPDSLSGESKITRDGNVIWNKPFLTGEANMTHSISNLEHHHFKYKQFCQSGDLHIHFFGTATLSFSDGIKIKDGDKIEIDLPFFGRKLSNTVKFENPMKSNVKKISRL